MKFVGSWPNGNIPQTLTSSSGDASKAWILHMIIIDHTIKKPGWTFMGQSMINKKKTQLLLVGWWFSIDDARHKKGLNYLSNTYPRWDIYQNAHHQGTWRVLIHLQVEIISCWPSRVRFVQRPTSQRNQQVEKSYTKKKNAYLVDINTW